MACRTLVLTSGGKESSQGHRHYRFKVLRDRSPGKDRRQRRRQHVADAEHKKRNHIRQLEALGYKVTLQPAA